MQTSVPEVATAPFALRISNQKLQLGTAHTECALKLMLVSNGSTSLQYAASPVQFYNMHAVNDTPTRAGRYTRTPAWLQNRTAEPKRVKPVLQENVAFVFTRR